MVPITETLRENSLINVHMSIKAKRAIYGLEFDLRLCVICASSEGSGETVPKHSLARIFADQVCD